MEAFYELYIELLFGESDEYDYDTCLMDDIRFVGDGEPSVRERRLFAITLVNRLLFVKFLETRSVLPEGFLRERVEHYREYGDEFAGNLYETQIRPLFYELLNTPEADREPKHRDPDGWFREVPYLNGGLFRENVEGESRYRVIDRILPDVIRDLIEGSRLELDGDSFDPALLGSVFEKTINHIEQERTQKDIGAYYTPNDVTEIVTEQSVDPKIRDVLVETFVESVADGEGDAADARSYLEELPLAELLQKIEKCDEAVFSPRADQTRIDFGDDETMAAAKQNLRELKVLDPACGSGHFLTTAMDEIHRAQGSILRGLADGEEPDDRTRFAEKKALALNAIYGVDVDRIAAEIAKLRVWLKIVEGNQWEPEFGKLPNIDVNITHGNSLVGLPLAGSFDDADVWNNDIGEIERKRIEYKRDDEGDPREIERYLDEEIRPALDRKYLELFSKPVETSIETAAEFDAVVESIDADTLYPTFSLVRVKREDGAAFSEDETKRLEGMGFSVYKKSAKQDVAEWERSLKTKENGNGGYDKAILAGKLRDLLEDGYVFSEVQRQPTQHDLDRILGKPFHWVAEFPEVAEERGNTHSIDFDIVLGNPPYGDLLSDEEKMFVSTYETSGIRDISANFVERQLQLLEEGGYFGNITTLRLVYQSDLTEFHDYLRDHLEQTDIACFAHRPQQVFPNAIVRIALLSGHKTNPDEQGEILNDEVPPIRWGEPTGDTYRPLLPERRRSRTQGENRRQRPKLRSVTESWHGDYREHHRETPGEIEPNRRRCRGRRRNRVPGLPSARWRLLAQRCSGERTRKRDYD
ncbi:Eco57I restriction-modification methylase domain-containing protein [Halorussus caseinilyticus]|uniref:site-specific DNA-methyltransferase (adenine-specific) n=1 Tax=Halorussus caseinilyticus TaxID=3034025 RepID=A0ABD5WU93_9EURY